MLVTLILSSISVYAATSFSDTGTPFSGFTISLRVNVVVKFFCFTNQALTSSHSWVGSWKLTCSVSCQRLCSAHT